MKPSTTIKIFFSCYQDVQKNSYVPNLLSTENLPPLSDPIPYQEYFYLSISAFLINLIAQNEEFSNVW